MPPPASAYPYDSLDPIPVNPSTKKEYSKSAWGRLREHERMVAMSALAGVAGPVGPAAKKATPSSSSSDTDNDDDLPDKPVAPLDKPVAPVPDDAGLGDENVDDPGSPDVPETPTKKHNTRGVSAFAPATPGTGKSTRSAANLPRAKKNVDKVDKAAEKVVEKTPFQLLVPHGGSNVPKIMQAILACPGDPINTWKNTYAVDFALGEVRSRAGTDHQLSELIVFTDGPLAIPNRDIE